MVLRKPDEKHVLQQFSLKGKKAAVTGGSRGIGLQACARGLAEAGADVAIMYNSTRNAHEIAETLAKETGVIVKAYQADVRNVDSISKTVDKISEDFGGLDIVIVNSGIADHIDALEYTPEAFSNIMKVNLDGAFWTAQAAAKIFKRQGSGNIIFTSSVSSKLVNVPQKQAPYNASKAAVSQLAKCLAVEWVDFCRVNIISPGFIATDMISGVPDDWKKKWHEMVPAGRFCETSELRGAYVFLASDASSYMTQASAWHPFLNMEYRQPSKRLNFGVAEGNVVWNGLDWMATGYLSNACSKIAAN